MSEVKLVPARMLLDKEVIGAINFHCGDGGDNFGEHSDGLLWIGTVTDDEGKEAYGLHLSTAEYPEEGSTTLVEFDEPVDAQRLRADTAEAELADMQHWRDLALQFDNHRMNAMFHLKTLVSDGAHYDAARDFLSEPPLSAHEVTTKLAAAEQRIADLKCLLLEVANSAPTGFASLDNEMAHRVNAALNPNPEAESHE